MKIYKLVFGFVGLFALNSTLNANDSITLKYTYRPDQTQVTLLKDGQGRMYLPLADVAKFYGIDLQFDAQTQRVLLSKSKNQVKLVLSQPMFMALNPNESFETDPVVEIEGQLAATPATAQDLLAAILGINSRFLPDQQVLMVGGVVADELKTEIVAQEQAVASVTPVVTVTLPAPTSTPSAEEVINARGEEETTQNLIVPRRLEDKRAYNVDCIVIDPGHGGKDIGAKGYDNRYFEKQATLSIATKVAQLLRQQPGLTVLMTRDRDYFVTLKGRTQYANKHKADLFVSIHCNSTPRSKALNASGTEIWVYSPKKKNHYADFEASQENTEGDGIDFFSDLHYQAYYRRSYKVAEQVEYFINKHLGQHIRRVQQANFYVLGRVDMPSILIETAFISNPREEFKLEDSDWQDNMARAIADGILSYRNIVENLVDVKQAQ
ncbi:MAG TPA: N-acetylmuramoyl-L-alanine amidase [bacterium]|nr:N-acetylmuramoyl-L-alanine amidase [bacterium]